jgi:amino acid permease
MISYAKKYECEVHMEPTVKKTWMPTTAGILNIVTGVFSILGAIGVIFAIVAIGSINIMSFLLPAEAKFIVPLIAPTLIVILVLSIARAVFTIIGGIFALQRRKWGWALTGSIFATIGTDLLGLASTIFVAIAKDEFE